jgi:hypothetical protein
MKSVFFTKSRENSSIFTLHSKKLKNPSTNKLGLIPIKIK